MQTVKQDSIMLLPKNGRTICLGQTSSGKSTLMDLLRELYLKQYPTARILLIDSKPRYKAEWTTSGIYANKHYKGWSRGEFIPNSFRIDKQLPIKGELYRVWGYNGHIAIAQTRPGDIADLRWLQDVARVFYAGTDKYPRLIVIDELADFFEVQRQAGIFHQIARSGRELNVALLAGSQFPRYIPKAILSECDRLYLFHLDNEDDMKTLYTMSLPKNVQQVPVDHSFFYWNKLEQWEAPSGRVYKLEK